MADTDKLAAAPAVTDAMLIAARETWPEPWQHYNLAKALRRALEAALCVQHSTDKATISALEAENKRLREALEPFSAASGTADKVADIHGANEFVLSFGPVAVGVIPLSAFRRARDLSRNRRETPDV